MAFKNLFGAKITKEGFAKKNSSAKGVDEVRGNWNQRWLVLKGSTLSYYERRGDPESKKKGDIDLTNAFVEAADDKCNKPFCIRVAQQQQIFTYFQMSNMEDRDSWIEALSKAVCTSKTREYADTRNVYCSFGGKMMFADVLKYIVVTLNCENGGNLLISENGSILHSYSRDRIGAVSFSRVTDKQNVNDNDLTLLNQNLFSVSLNVTTSAGASLEHKVFVGTPECAVMLYTLIGQLRDQNLTAITEYSDSKVFLRAWVRFGEVVPDQELEKRYILLTSKNLLIFNSSESPIPLWFYVLPHAHSLTLTLAQVNLASGRAADYVRPDGASHCSLCVCAPRPYLLGTGARGGQPEQPVSAFLRPRGALPG
jgi:hypothetical protein